MRLPGEKERGALQRCLLEWFSAQKRDLPWRRTQDPYAILVAEVMLQQTRTEVVLDHYLRFLGRFPTWEALAKASLEEVLRAWEGLGYYRRARHLHALARRVVEEHGGRLPSELSTLRSLPGIGEYTAGAVLSIAFGQRIPAVDGNAERVLCRLFGVEGNPARQPWRGFLQRLAAHLLPAEAPGLFNQALMELGARICVPRRPVCFACPLAERCVAHREGKEGQLPRREGRPNLEERTDVAVWLVGKQGWLLVQRPEGEPWASLWELPRRTLEEGEEPRQGARRALQEVVGLEGEVGDPCLSLRHSITRWRVTLHIYPVLRWQGEPQALGCAAWRWVAPEEVGRLPLPRPQRRAVEALRRLELSQDGRPRWMQVDERVVYPVEGHR